VRLESRVDCWTLAREGPISHETICRRVWPDKHAGRGSGSTSGRWAVQLQRRSRCAGGGQQAPDPGVLGGGRGPD
jgi:hypothetical protein